MIIRDITSISLQAYQLLHFRYLKSTLPAILSMKSVNIFSIAKYLSQFQSS